MPKLDKVSTGITRCGQFLELPIRKTTGKHRQGIDSILRLLDAANLRNFFKNRKY